MLLDSGKCPSANSSLHGICVVNFLLSLNLSGPEKDSWSSSGHSVASLTFNLCVCVCAHTHVHMHMQGGRRRISSVLSQLLPYFLKLGPLIEPGAYAGN